jgi:hypothetical protein
MSKLAVGQLEGLASEGYRISVASGSKFVQVGATLQVVQTLKSDTFTSTTAGSWTDITGMSVTITPLYSTSKLLVIPSISYASSSGNNGVVRMLRGSTVVYAADAASNRPCGFASTDSTTYTNIVATGMFLDSPATTSAVTYKLQFIQNSGTFAVNRNIADRDATAYDGRTISSMTVMEVAG